MFRTRSREHTTPQPAHAPSGASPASRHRTRLKAISWISGALVLTALTVSAVRSGADRDVPNTEDGVELAAPASRHAVSINSRSGPPHVLTGLTNFQGQPVAVSCSSCHATTKPNRDTRSADDLKEFHQGLNYAHGALSCLSCHDSANYDALRLADGTSLDFSDSMTLCSQCHGPQRRDYDRGLHGGMNGYWDLTRGGRTRNTCVDCHDAHSPAFPMVMPVLAPHDRISVPSKQTTSNAAH